MLRYFFPPAFRIPKDDVNSMTAEELVAFPLVRQIIAELTQALLKNTPNKRLGRCVKRKSALGLV